MPGKRKRLFLDANKNRNLDDFLSGLKIETDKRDKIIDFVENLTFQKVKEASAASQERKSVIRLNR